jgi:hypothetical protein
MTGARLGGRRMSLASEEPDRVLRLHRFRQVHPGVIVGDGGFGTFQRRIPVPSGEIVTTRYTLRELLDKLNELISGQPEEPG